VKLKTKRCENEKRLTERQKSSFTEIFEEKLDKVNVTCEKYVISSTVNIDPTSRVFEVFHNVNR
jgi:CRISPR/Cas system CSM-associated protein Csm2 small subunit